MKKLGLLLLLSIFAIAGCSDSDASNSESGSSGETVVLKAGHVVDENHPYQHGLVKFGELLEERTDGRIKVEIYHSGQIGSETEMLDGLKFGTVDLLATASAPVSSTVPNIAVFDLPYLFISAQHAYKVMDSEIGDSFFDELEKEGIIGLGYFENGFRHITNSEREVKTPEDMKGIKIRVMENPVAIEAFKTMGANATPMAWGEVFTALQQGTIDAQENPIPVIYNQKLSEVQQYLSLSGHFYSPALFLMSDKALSKLSEEDQAIVMEAAKEATAHEREISQQQEKDFIDNLREEGMIITEVDKEKFREAMEPVYAKFEDQFGKELIDSIINFE